MQSAQFPPIRGVCGSQLLGGHKRVLFVFVGGAKTLIGFLSAHAVLWHALPLKIMVRTSLW